MPNHKFYYMSDLHIEFGMLFIPEIEGENLILAGDITVLRCFDGGTPQMEKIRSTTLSFLNKMCSRFDRVFYVTGNHEPYGFDIQRTDEIIEKHFPKKIIYLNDSCYSIDNETVVMGGTLWTDMNNHSKLSMEMVQWGMNDFQIVRNGPGSNLWTPEDAYQKHIATREYLGVALENNKNRKCVVVSHHAPTYQGINPEHGGSSLNAGYASNLERFILDRPQISHWVFGHTHIQKQFRVGNTHIVSNAKGYEGREACARTWKPNTYFEVNTEDQSSD